MYGTILCSQERKSSFSKLVLYWTPDDKGRGEKPINTWQRTVDGDLKVKNHTLRLIQIFAQDREEWGAFFTDLHGNQQNGQFSKKVYKFLSPIILRGSYI